MKIINIVNQELRNLTYHLISYFGKISENVNFNVSYVSQFSNNKNSEQSLKTMNVEFDNDWRLSGAESKEEYARWAYTMCGMACLSMILQHFYSKTIRNVELANDALANGVYDIANNEISGMKYQPFVKWIEKFNLLADVYSKLSIKGIQYALSHSKLVIVSVNPNIRGFNTSPQDQIGGHLVLVVGYDLRNSTITINNPSGFESTQTQKNHTNWFI
jgi:hypothetical protein